MKIISNNIIEEIITLLEARYPNRLPKEEVDKFSMGLLVGHQEVIDFIKDYLNRSSQ
jgi:hypothetical protein